MAESNAYSVWVVNGSRVATVTMTSPAAFRGLGPADAMQWTYYSFVTLTTVGYGDT